MESMLVGTGEQKYSDLTSCPLVLQVQNHQTASRFLAHQYYTQSCHRIPAAKGLSGVCSMHCSNMSMFCARMLDPGRHRTGCKSVMERSCLLACDQNCGLLVSRDLRCYRIYRQTANKASHVRSTKDSTPP